MYYPDQYYYDEKTGKWYELLYQPDGEPLNFIIDGDTLVLKPNAVPIGQAPFPDVLDEIETDDPQNEVTPEPEPEKKKRGRPRKIQ